jgi:hypothetical protein
MQWLIQRGPLHEQLVRPVPPALPVGRWACLATQAPLAVHVALLVECSQKYSCEEGMPCRQTTPNAPAADDGTRSNGGQLIATGRICHL